MKKQLLTLAASFAFVAAFAQHFAPVQTMVIPYTATPMTIDGVDDEDAWSAEQTCKQFLATPVGDADFSQVFRAAYDKNFLYVYVEVTDDEKGIAADPNSGWNYDNIEVFFDIDTAGAGATAASNYDTNTIQIRFTRGYDSVTASGRAVADDYKFYIGQEDAPGWIVEVGIPWKFVLGTKQTNKDMLAVMDGITASGFEVTGADADGTGTRDAQSAWDLDGDATNNAYLDRKCLGVVTLQKPTSAVDIYTATSAGVYPNPTTGMLYFNTEVNSVQIMNLAGQVVLSRDVKSNMIDLSSLQTGVYIANIDGNFTRVIKN